MTCFNCLSASRPSNYNPPEVQELMKYPAFSNMDEQDVMAFHMRYRGITKGQPFLNRPQFIDMLRSFSLYPSRKVADRMFDIVDRDGSSQIDFIEFMKYIFLLLDGSKDEKSNFIFSMIANKGKDAFTFHDLTSFYNIVDAGNELSDGSFSTRDMDEEQSESMAASVFEIMGKGFYDKIDLAMFTNFIKQNDQAIMLFNFLNADLESTTKHVRIKGSYTQILKMLKNLQGDVNSLKETLEINGLIDDGEPVYFKKKSMFNRTFCNALKDHIKNVPSQNKTGNKENGISFVPSEHSKHDSRRSILTKKSGVTNLIKTLGLNNESNIDGSNISSQDSDDNGKKNRNKQASMYTTGIISAINRKVSKLILEIEREINTMSKEEKFTSDLRSNFSPQDNETDSKKKVFINNPNWNIVTTMVAGINRSLSLVSIDRYHSLCDHDFKYYNKIEVDSVYSNQFDRCKFKDYAPYVFQSMRRQYGISHESYIRSIGVNTFRDVFFDKLYLMLSETSTGKSGSFFFHTSDGKYMIKTIKKVEFDTLMKILPAYHEHVLKNPNTLLAKYFGLHQLKCYHGSKLKYDLYVLIMNNVFSLENPELIQHKYDLKGSTHRRITAQKEVALGAAKKDINFISDGMKMKIDSALRDKLLKQLESDVSFLARHNIIDYSLLVGITDNSKRRTRKFTMLRAMDSYEAFEPKFELQKNQPYIQGKANNLHYYIGIIDTLTPFDSLKMGEYVAKRIFQGNGVSCAPPQHYKERFLAFMKKAIDT